MTVEAGGGGKPAADWIAELSAALPKALIALDFDGTLAPIVDRPEDARVLPAAAEAVNALARVARRVAIITGRPASFVVDRLQLEASSPVVVLGGYGRETWRAGILDAPGPLPTVRAALEELRAVVAGAPEGTTLEDKGAGVAVHVRQTDDPASALAALGPAVARIGEAHGLRLEPGRMVLELRAPGPDKGTALLAQVEECTPSAVVFAGDDLGDAPAFDAIDELKRRGLIAVSVCSASDEVAELATRADLTVDGPRGVADLLEALL